MEQNNQTRKVNAEVVTSVEITMADEKTPKLQAFPGWDDNYYLYEGCDFTVKINANDDFLQKTDEEIKEYLTDNFDDEGFWGDFGNTSWGGDPNYWDVQVNKESIKVDRVKKTVEMLVEIVDGGT